MGGKNIYADLLDFCTNTRVEVSETEDNADKKDLEKNNKLNLSLVPSGISLGSRIFFKKKLF